MKKFQDFAIYSEQHKLGHYQTFQMENPKNIHRNFQT